MTEDTPQQECPLPRTPQAVDCWLRKWGRDAAVDGTEPLTRQDVERLIQANGGTAQGLDLSGRDMRGIDLSPRQDQQGQWLGFNLQGAVLSAADLQGARLWATKLQGANLFDTDLQGANLWFIQLSRETNLEEVIWPGEYVLPLEEQGHFDAIQSTYRSLKTWHQEHGFYDIAGEFHHREMVCQRKATFPKLFGHLERKPTWLRVVMSVLPSIALMILAIPLAMLFFWARRDQKFKPYWSYDFLKLARFTFYEQLFGYGERPWRVVRAAAAVLGLALAYYFFGTFDKPGFIDALYFSAVSFSALGYGSWAPEPQGWAKYMGVAESFLGVFTIALFLVTFTRKMVR